ncbi:MAG: RdgB/HAM1 family non-canonical purine NTP pyrophosphatase [Bryobacteraceae bacterium]|nr:RdgB/HAM1 family non-canonical purine NTP pyrophosphatase [Bryobacteraceae bacterium]MDW8380317.1 RdgB/HAM1 family non-canonical purine NTP pyrophosphatase [Bryobacterales bacterium]
MILYCATSNRHKLREFEHAAQRLAPGSFQILPLPGLGELQPPPETGDTFEANAIEKALYYSQWTQELVFADDSGLAVEALGGAPGVLSARYAGPSAGDQANNQLLLRNLQGVTHRAAEFVCVIALAQAKRLIRTFRGAVRGEILHQERGVNGFGYDPLFYHPPFGCTFAEATPDQKLLVSHRGQAFAQLIEYLKQRI